MLSGPILVGLYLLLSGVRDLNVVECTHCVEVGARVGSQLVPPIRKQVQVHRDIHTSPHGTQHPVVAPVVGLVVPPVGLGR